MYRGRERNQLMHFSAVCGLVMMCWFLSGCVYSAGILSNSRAEVPRVFGLLMIGGFGLVG